MLRIRVKNSIDQTANIGTSTNIVKFVVEFHQNMWYANVLILKLKKEDYFQNLKASSQAQFDKAMS